MQNIDNGESSLEELGKHVIKSMEMFSKINLEMRRVYKRPVGSL